ncbi:MAG: hypothetical protein K9K38_18440 [Rhodoferax sp.]|nr:hypothetical protein [Rhodoferax sp.]
MIESNSDESLTIIGMQPSTQGIVTLVHISVAIPALEAAINAHEAAESRAGERLPTVLHVQGGGARLRAHACPSSRCCATAKFPGRMCPGAFEFFERK